MNQSLPAFVRPGYQSTQTLDHDAIQRLLQGVDKPGRYVGGEANSIVKDDDGLTRMALCFPDVYEVAESHIGYKILYDIINRDPRFAAERAYALWPDLEARAREEGVPLWSLETYRPLSGFDVLGFTLQYELCYTTVLAMLELGNVPLEASDRDDTHPLVIGGGVGAYNPEPIAPFFDAFFLGDAEEAVVEILATIEAGKKAGLGRAQMLLKLAEIEGIYIPGHYTFRYEGKKITAIEVDEASPVADLRSKNNTPRVPRRIVRDLNEVPYPTKTIVPNVKPIHDRIAIEIQRGCSQSCRFCQAGMINRPTRQRSPQNVLKLADESLKSCGSDELSLLSLSAGDYGPINEVLSEFFGRYAGDNISIALPSMRTETVTPELAEQIATVRKGGFTFAPEAGSERMRRVINKTNSEENLVNAAKAAAEAGWRRLKFYFMIGLPTETDEDIYAIVNLAYRARKAAREIRRDIDVTVSVSTFVPKPHTSFQWEGQINVDETLRKQRLLKSLLREKKIAFRYHGAELSYLEGVVTRGDRRLAPALVAAMRAGCRLDSWGEWHDSETWHEVLAQTLGEEGLCADDYLRERDAEEILPWDHLDAGVLKKFMLRDRKRAYAEATIGDCAFVGKCYACGGCELGDPYTAAARKENGGLVQLQPLTFDAGSLKENAAPSMDVPPAQSPAPEIPQELASESSPERAMVQRIRIRYAKLGRAFHFSHLDVKEHIFRALRLAKVPVLYSKGFTPRPRVNFTPACPTGVASEAEYFELDCYARCDVEDLSARVQPRLPEGLFIIECLEVDTKGEPLNAMIAGGTYILSRPKSLPVTGFKLAVEAFLRAETVPVKVLRKKKARVLDAKARVDELMVTDDHLSLFLIFSQGGSMKIGEVAAAIFGVETAESMRIRKSEIRFHQNKPPHEQKLPELSGEGALDLRHLGKRMEKPVFKGLGPRNKPKDKSGLTVPYAE